MSTCFENTLKKLKQKKSCVAALVFGLEILYKSLVSGAKAKLKRSPATCGDQSLDPQKSCKDQTGTGATYHPSHQEAETKDPQRKLLARLAELVNYGLSERAGLSV